jgi:hypothetical protein
VCDAAPDAPFSASEILSRWSSEDIILTDEHAASSYGMPVVVRADGSVNGPADVPKGAYVRVPQEALEQDDAFALAEAAVIAGWDLCGDVEHIKAQRRRAYLVGRQEAGAATREELLELEHGASYVRATRITGEMLRGQ